MLRRRMPTSVAIAALAGLLLCGAAVPAQADGPTRWELDYTYVDTNVCGFPITISGTSWDSARPLGPEVMPSADYVGGWHHVRLRETWTGPTGLTVESFGSYTLQRRDADTSGLIVATPGQFEGVVTATDHLAGVSSIRVPRVGPVYLDSARYTLRHTSVFVNGERVSRTDELLSIQGRPDDVRKVCAYLAPS